MLFRILLGLAVMSLAAGCAVAKTTAGAAAGVGKAAVKTTAGVTGDVAEAAFDSDEKPHEPHGDDPRPYDPDRDAMADVDAALAAATVSRRNVLLVLGGNWCHDSRGIAAKFQRPELAAVIADGYELVWVDVGYRDRNLDVAARFGVMDLYGTPTVLILSPEGDLLNRQSVHDWRTADSKPYGETLEYFQLYAPER